MFHLESHLPKTQYLLLLVFSLLISGEAVALNRFFTTQSSAFNLVNHTPLMAQIRLSKPSLKFSVPPAHNSLNQNSISDILQDENGFLWFATLGGLHKYDGYAFRRLDPKIQSNVPQTPWVKTLFEDDHGHFWVGSFRGEVYRIDKESGEMTDFTLRLNPNHFDSDPLAQDFGGQINSFYQQDNGLLWIGSNNGLATYNPETDTVTINPDAGWFEQRLATIYTIAPASEQHIWISSDQGLIRYNLNSKQVQRFQFDSESASSISSNNLTVIYPDGDSVWVGTRDAGLNRLNLATQEFSRYSSIPEQADTLASNNISDIIRDSKNRLWVATFGGGLHLYNQSEDNFFRYTKTKNNLHGLPSNDIWSLYEDHSGVLWIGTAGAGLVQINPDATRFSSIERVPYLSNSLNDEFVWDLALDEQQNLWIATLNGLHRYERSTGKIELFLPQPPSPGSTANNGIGSIIFDKHGLLWLGMTDGRLFLFDRETEQFSELSFEGKRPFSSERIWHLFYDQQQQLWISTVQGVYVLDETQQRRLIDGSLAKPVTPLIQTPIRTAYQDHLNRYWLGMAGTGLKVLAPDLTELAHFYHQPQQSNSLSDNTVRSIMQQIDHTLWVGTASGLNRLSAKDMLTLNQNFSAFDSRDGLPDDTIYNLINDPNNGMIWAGTNNGLSRFDPDVMQFENFDRRDGMIANEFNGGAELITNDGTLFFGSIKGVVYFNPQSIKTNKKAPETVLTQLKINKDFWNNPYSMNKLQQLQLDYTESNLLISFAAIDYRQPQKNQFRYRLFPLQSDWIDNGNQTSVKYLNLEHGDYVFQVQGSNNDGVWSDNIRRLNIEIMPPWWQHPIAYALYVMMALIAFYLYQRNQSQKLKREKQISADLARVNRLKDEFLANTSHELKTPLNGIIGLSQNLLESTSNSDKEPKQQTRQALKIILSSGQRLASLVNNILDVTRLKQDTLNLQKEHLDLYSIIRSIIEQNIAILSGKDIRVTCNIEPGSLAILGDEMRIKQIFDNLINNAIKFTHEGSVVISAYQQDQQVVTCVADTGTGVESNEVEHIFEDFSQVDGSTTRSYGGVGLGLSITRKLVELHQGKIWLQSTPGKGSQFYVSLPKGSSDHAAVTLPHSADTEEPFQLSGYCEFAPEIITEGDDQEAIPGTQHKTVPAITPGSRDSTSFLDSSLSKNIKNLLGQKPALIRKTPQNKAVQKSKSILVVDDEPVNRMVLRNHLKRLGHQVDVAEDGYLALEKVKQSEYHLILLDVMMPGLSGLSVCEQLRENYSLFQLPILMVSAKALQEDIVAGLKAGANDYITKPVEPLEFSARVQTLLSLKELDQTRTERDQAQELAKANQELALHYAQYDQLTLLPNRSSLFESMHKWLQHHQDADEQSSGPTEKMHIRFALILINLDRFQQINESYGHLIGDRILQEMAERLKHNTPKQGLCARMGSDEFAMVLPLHSPPDEYEREQRDAFIDQLIASITQPILLDEPPIILQTSLGIAHYPEHAINHSDLLRCADLAMVKAKQSGGSCYFQFDKQATEHLRGASGIESKMRHGLKHNQFKVYVQPLVHSHNQTIKSAEALVRWQTEQELISPARFIPIAENTNLIIELGEEILKQVCMQLQQWLQQKQSVVPIAVNVSMLQLMRSDFVTTVQTMLSRYSIPAHLLELEVTESAMTENIKQFRNLLSQLKALGVRIAIDDFGTGFSSLSYLKSLPVDKLKIDRSFITDIISNQQSRNIVQSIINLSHELKLEVVSEGVEDELTLQHLRRMGCDTIQGYFISRPFPMEQLIEFNQTANKAQSNSMI